MPESSPSKPRLTGPLARLRLPVIGAPMFLVSGPELVIAQCRAGILGAFPALNARGEGTLAAWIGRIRAALAAHDAAHPDRPAAPFAVNLILHPSNPRWEADLAVCVAERVPVIITSLQAPDRVVEAVRGHGGVVLHDVTTARHARKAIAGGVDGLIAVAHGAGGHAGRLNPFALLAEMRGIWDGPLVLAGGIARGEDVAAALAAGADLAYVGTRFIAAAESAAPPAYKAAVAAAHAEEIVLTDAVSGVPGNFLGASLAAAGLDPATLPAQGGRTVDLSSLGDGAAKAWRDIWSAGHSVAGTPAVMPVEAIADALSAGLRRSAAALARWG